LTVIAAFMVNFTACGLLFCFGIYQAHYETLATQASTPFNGASSSEIDLIGSLSVSLMTIGAPFAVAWAKYFGSPRIVWAGGILFGLANILASFGKALWHFQLTQGLLLGIGTCLSFVPSMAVTPRGSGHIEGSQWASRPQGPVLVVLSGHLLLRPVLTALAFATPCG
jgi:hypothetical protein